MTTLLIHSTGTAPFMWDSIPEELVPAAQRLAPANLGYPPHAPVPRGQAVSLADDVAHLLAQLPAEGPLDVVAHSYGGLLALEALPKLGARVRSMFLWEPVMFGALAKDPSADSTQVREFTSNPWFLTDQEKGGTEPWLELFIDYWNRPGSWARLPEPMRQHNLRVGWKMFQEVRSVFFSSRTFEAHPLPRVPVTLAMGERSPAGSRETMKALLRHNPHVKLVDVPGTGHMAPLTHPQKLNDALAAHLHSASVTFASR